MGKGSILHFTWKLFTTRCLPWISLSIDLLHIQQSKETMMTEGRWRTGMSQIHCHDTSENIAMLSTIIHCRNPPLCHIKRKKKESNDEKLRNYSKMVLLLNNTGSPSPFLTIKGKLFSYTSYGTCNSFYPWFWLQELGEFETNQLCTNLSQKAKSI